MSKELISIVISTKNEEANLGRLLKSIKEQAYPAYEIIVVDNYSRDATVQIAAQYTDKVFSVGPERSRQRNFGAQKARGNFLFFLDADMKLPPDALSTYHSECQNNHFAAMRIPEEIHAENYWAQCRGLEKKILQGENNFAAARFIRKEAFQKIGGYDEKINAGEDYDLDDRLKSGNYSIGTSGLPLLHLGQEHLIEICKKKYYYGKILQHYLRKSPLLAWGRFFPKRIFYFMRSKLFWQKPKVAGGLIILKLVDYTCGFAGLLVSIFANGQSS